MTETPQEIERRYRLLIEHVTDYAIFMMDVNGLVSSWNQGAERILGYKEEEILGQPGGVVFTSEDRARGLPEQELKTAAQAGRATDERWHVRKDGSRFYASGVMTAVLDEGGALVGYAKLMRDRTARKLAEARLVTEHAVSRVLAEATHLHEAIPAVIEAVCRTSGWQCGNLWEVAPQRDVLRWLQGWSNPTFSMPQFEAMIRQITFAADVGLPGRVWASGAPALITDVAEEDNFPRRQAAIQAGLHGAIGFPIFAGEQVLGVMEFFSERVRSPDEPLVDMMLVVGRQVGQFIRRRRAEEALARSEARTAAILHAALDCIVSMDHAGRVTEWNPAAEQTFGYTRNEVIGREMAELIIPPALRDPHRAGLARFLATGEGAVIGRRLELPAVRKDGSEFPIELSITRMAVEGPPSFTGQIRDITERRRQEAALKESEERLRLGMDAGNTGTWDWDIVSGKVAWSERVYEFHGVRPGEFPGTIAAFAQIVHPDDVDRVQAAIQNSVSTGSPYEIEFRVRHDNGAVRWLTTNGRVFHDSTGQPVRMLGATSDVTDRKVAEAALRSSEQRFRFLSELGEMTSQLIEPEEVVAAAVRHLGVHLGASRCADADVEADGEHFIIHPDYADGCASSAGRYRLSNFGSRAATAQRAGHTLVVNDVAAELTPQEGAETFNAIAIKAIVCCPLVRGGQLLAMMAVHQTTPRRWSADEVGLVEAVVERSWAYIERARVARALRQSEQNLRRLADAMPQIVWAARPDGVLDYYNRRWFEYIDLPHDAGDTAVWDRYIHPDDLPRACESWSLSLRSGEPYTIEFRVRGGDRNYRWFLARALPIRDGDARIVRWYGTCTDIHDQKQLQAENEHLLDSERAARAQAERASRMKDEFLANLSHELRTPLNAILGWSQILASGTRDEADLAEGLRTIERNARAQTQIIEDLLDMSRIISGKVRLDVQRVDLAAVVQAAVETVRPAANAKGVRFQMVLDPVSPTVSGDPNRLQQIFWNLLSNGVKFTPRGGRVQVVLERVNSHLEISVIDTGEGIRPEFLPHVFDRFRQGDATSTRTHGGLGLGLSIVKQLVELHGGTVRAASGGPGQGSTFAVTLPLTPLLPTSLPEVERRHPAADFALPPSAVDACIKLSGVRVLVVDDELDARLLVKRVLEDCEAIVTIASSAAEALEAIRLEKPDVLLSDIGMPGEDGYVLIRNVRALGPTGGGDVPAIALTAYARSDDRRRAMLAGYQTHIAKPVEPAELIATVASLAGRTGRS